MLLPIIVLVALAAGLLVLAPRFSPYEALRLSGEPQRVGLLAFADGVDRAALDAAARQAAEDQAELAQARVANLQIFVRELAGRPAVFAYFETAAPGLDGLTTVLGRHSAGTRALEARLTPHPRAAPGQVWLRMEWMNLIATTTAFPHQHQAVQPLGLVSGLKPASEPQYRQLHQTNWPGVVDAMVQARHRNWTTFLAELDEALYLFTYAEYIGTNRDADNAVMAADPATQRWWKQTQPCLIDLHGEGSWSIMQRAGD